jgi:hypothetical protein
MASEPSRVFATEEEFDAALAESPRVWAMPEEPGPEVRYVVDRDGEQWYHSGDRWVGRRYIRDWEVLVVRSGPLTEVPSGKDETP